MAESSLARSAQESPGLVACFRHEGEQCPRCDGSGFRPAKRCAGCGEAAGSASKGTGFPLVKDRRTDGRLYHVRCLPGTRELDAVWSGLERMGDSDCVFLEDATASEEDHRYQEELGLRSG
jgi:hypothetical protein